MSSSISMWEWKGAPMSAVGWPLGLGSLYAIVCIVWARKVSAAKASPKTGTNAAKPPSAGFLQKLLAAHNLVLSLMSAVMLAGASVALYSRTTTSKSAMFLVCEDEQTVPRGALFFWSYMYYLSKYYEFVDTFLALAKGSIPPSFRLHVFHHAFVPLLAWLWLETVQSLQFIGLLFNTGVHVIMYYYYFLRTQGQFPSWKNWVTRSQIIQFVFSFVMLVVCLLIHFNPDVAREVLPATGLFKASDLPGNGCAGMASLVYNAIFNGILLAGFLGVLSRNTKATSRGSKPKAN